MSCRPFEAMNEIPGTPYPEKIGGKVAAPAFVFCGGDLTDAPTPAAVSAIDEIITKRPEVPLFRDRRQP